jgi:hypothetical protein
MRFPFTFIFMSLLVAGCHRHDSKPTQQIEGAWKHEGGFDMTFSPDGSFSSGSSSFAYQGVWQVNADGLVMTITNATGTKPHELAGSVDRMKIIQVDENHLALESSGQTIYYERK